MGLNRLDFVLALFDLLWLPGTECPDDQANDEEGGRRQQQHAVWHVPAAIVHGLKHGDTEQGAYLAIIACRATRLISKPMPAPVEIPAQYLAVRN